MIGIWFGVLFTVQVGLVLALLWLANAVYVGFFYVPFAARIRRWEKSRGR